MSNLIKKDMYTSLTSSMAGFHNPERHDGMTKEDFWDEYIMYLLRSKNPYHWKILVWISHSMDNFYHSLYFLHKHFSRTLLGGAD